MKDYQAANIRNIAIVGHGGDGKTTLAEALLFAAGAVERMGKVDDGTTATDYDAEEAKRHISISAAVAPFEWKDCKINLIDVPGYFDFIGEQVGPLNVADGALIVMSAVSGLVVGTEKAWSNCQKAGVPRMIIINQMDRENASFQKALDQVKDKYGSVIAPIQVPYMQGNTLKGYVDVLSGKAYEFAGKTVKEIPVPADLQSLADDMREQVMEAAAGADDALMEKFFEDGELSAEDTITGLKSGVAQGLVVPVLCAAAASGAGCAPIADAICAMMPSPSYKPPKEGINPKNDEADTRACDTAAPFSAQVFKTVADPFVGKLSLFKVYSGSISSDTVLYNPASEKTEKAGTVYTMRGKKQTTVDKLIAGDIGAVAKLQYTNTGDTLCDAAKPIRFPAFNFPKPCISLAVGAKNQGEEDKIFAGLHRLEEEDITFRVEKSETGETLVSGLGELHLEVICAKLKSKFGVEAVLSDPKVPYRESIRKSIKAEGRHKKQSGGHGQFGHCWVEFEPILDGSAEFEFVDKIVGGVVPRQYIPAVEKGLRENLPRGVIAGYPLVNVRATLFDGSYHAVDSSEMAFKTAARLALRKCVDASPVLLEPVYHIDVVVPDEYMGDIIGDMNRRRGRILGMNQVEDGQMVSAEVPLSEIFKYATDLRSMTQARGAFDTNFERYEEVPASQAQKIIDNAKKVEDEDE